LILDSTETDFILSQKTKRGLGLDNFLLLAVPRVEDVEEDIVEGKEGIAIRPM
jgi:hypothetical protein